MLFFLIVFNKKYFNFYIILIVIIKININVLKNINIRTNNKKFWIVDVISENKRVYKKLFVKHVCEKFSSNEKFLLIVFIVNKIIVNNKKKLLLIVFIVNKIIVNNKKKLLLIVFIVNKSIVKNKKSFLLIIFIVNKIIVDDRKKFLQTKTINSQI